MGFMTDHTSFDLLRRVLIDPGAFLFRMTFEARLIFFAEAGLPQAGPFPGPMWIMAFGALQRPLEHFMGVREIKLWLHVLMTRKTEVDFIRLQKCFANGLAMNLMAIVASHSA